MDFFDLTRNCTWDDGNCPEDVVSSLKSKFEDMSKLYFLERYWRPVLSSIQYRLNPTYNDHPAKVFWSTKDKTYVISFSYALTTIRDSGSVVLKHEVLHILFGHLFADRWSHLKDWDIQCLAKDLSINSFINDRIFDGFHPENTTTHHKFGRYFPIGKSTDEYYAMLEEVMTAPDTPDDSKDSEEEEKTENSLSVTAPNSDTKEKKEEEERDTDSSSSCGNSSAKGSSGPEEIHESDNPTEEMSLTSDPDAKTALESIQKNIPEYIGEAEEGEDRSSLFKDYDVSIFDVEKLKVSRSWISLLRSFTLGTIDVNKVIYNYKRPSRRTGNFPSPKKAKIKNLIIALDVSGSIDANSMQKLLGALRDMYQWIKGDIEIWEFNNTIVRKFIFDKKSSYAPVGYGGTHMEVVFDELRSMPKNKRPGGVVFLTDGNNYNVLPATLKIKSCPAIFLVYGGSDQAEWMCGQVGKVIHM